MNASASLAAQKNQIATACSLRLAAAPAAGGMADTRRQQRVGDGAAGGTDQPKASSLRPDWRRIERNVPRGICLRAAGTMAVLVGDPVFRYLTWLPRWETKTKPARSKALTISLEE